jgi:hypothetical protein
MRLIQSEKILETAQALEFQLQLCKLFHLLSLSCHTNKMGIITVGDMCIQCMSTEQKLHMHYCWSPSLLLPYCSSPQSTL